MANESRKSVRDVMTRNPQCVSEKDNVRDAARIMKDQDTGVVPVVDGKKIVGMITDRDIVIRCVAAGKNPLEAKVKDVMSAGVRKVKEDATINEVLTMMSSAEIRRVPVVDGNDEIIGIVSMADIATEGNQDGQVGQTVERISQAPPNN
jgi:CBS domain-containing protein